MAKKVENVDELRARFPGPPTPKTVYRWVRAGLIPAVRVGRTLYFDTDKIDQWIAEGGSASLTARRERGSAVASAGDSISG